MNWHKAIAEASSVATLVSVVNEFLLQQPEEFWTCIPKAVRPRLCASAGEVQAWHRALAEAVGDASRSNERLQELCVVFLLASARSLEIEPPHAKPSNDHEFGATATDGAGRTL